MRNLLHVNPHTPWRRDSAVGMNAALSRFSAAVALALTFVAGYIDAIGYLSLGRVYIANMSGNSVSVGIGAGSADLARLARYAWPVAGFFAGLIVARLLVNCGIALHWPSLAAAPLALETCALAAFLAVPRGLPGVLFGSAAMGLQAATLSKFNGATVYTCFVTGTLVKAAENVADIVVSMVRGIAPAPDHVRWALWFALAWVVYVLGAFLGTLGFGRFGAAAAVLPMGAVAVLAAADWISPSRLDRDIARCV